MAELWTTTSQSEVGGTQAGDTHTVISCTRKGSSPEMAGSGELAAPVVDGAPYASKRDTNTPMTTNHRKTILHFRSSWHKSQADFQAKMDDWDRPNRAVHMGRLKGFKKNENWDPLTAQSGSVQTMDPTQARGQGLLDHRRECDHLEQPRHTAKALSMRRSRVILGGKKPSTNKKGCVLREPLETRKKLHAGIFGKT